MEIIGRLIESQNAPEALECLRSATTELVPTDRGAALMEMRGVYPHCIGWPDYSSRWIPRFNNHYSWQIPNRYRPHDTVLGPVAWRDYRDTEFVTDFHYPMGIHHSVGFQFLTAFDGRRYSVWVHRGRSADGFEDAEIEAIRRMVRTASRIVSLRKEIDASRRMPIEEIELGPDADVLSRREAEVARLICRRLTMREIGGTLRISPRTVERHALHIYAKLGVANRKELLRRLGSAMREW